MRSVRRRTLPDHHLRLRPATRHFTGATEKPRINQIRLVVTQRTIIRQRKRFAPYFGENQLPRRSIPFIRGSSPKIVIHRAFRQQTKLIGAALLHDLQIGMALSQFLDILREFGRLVRPGHGDPGMFMPRRLYRQAPHTFDDLPVRVFRVGIGRHPLFQESTAPAPREIHLAPCRRYSPSGRY